MALTKYKIGDLVKVVDERNNLGIRDFYGININKEFMPTSATTDGLDETKYKVVRKNRYVYSGMQTGRDGCIRISMYTEEKPILVSPAYTTFEVSATDIINPLYFFMRFLSTEMDRFGAFCSDGSVRANLDWDVFCDIELELPPIEIQQKYMDIYNAMLANQKAYEQGLDDLKLTCDAFIENNGNKSELKKLGLFIELNDKRNHDRNLSSDDIMGFDVDGDFIAPKRVFAGNIESFRIIGKDDFVYNPRIPKITYPVALNKTEKDILVSPAYVSFYISKKERIDEEYLLMILQRENFSRKVLFNTWGSSTPFLRHDDLCDIEIPVPKLSIQKSIVKVFKSYNNRRIINEKLKSQIKDICPTLIKGSLQEARKND